MRVVHRYAVRKARETERNRQHLHTLEHHLIWLYTWRQQAKQGKTPKNTAHMHHICTLSGRKPPQEPCASTSPPSPSKMERGRGPRQPCLHRQEGSPNNRLVSLEHTQRRELCRRYRIRNLSLTTRFLKNLPVKAPPSPLRWHFQRRRSLIDRSGGDKSGRIARGLG